MRLSYRSSVFNSFNSNATVVILDESAIDMNLRRSLNQDRLMDPNDSYTTELGLPEQRQAHRSFNL